MRRWMVVIALLSPFASACLPFHGWVRVRPDIYGVIVKQGHPVAGALVCFCDGAVQFLASPCKGSLAATRTDDSGVFHLEGEAIWTTIQIQQPIFGISDSGYGGTFCIEAEGAPPESARWFNLGYLPKSFDADCDLSMEAERRRDLGGPCVLTRRSRFLDFWILGF